MSKIEIEIDGRNNERLFFVPLDSCLRGRIDFARVKGQGTSVLREEWPDPIPGIVLGFDGEKAWLRDPLYDAEHSELRAKIEQAGHRLGKARQEFSNIHAPTWAHWLKQAIDSGYAKVISGSMPKVTGEPKLDLNPNRQESALERLAKLVAALLTPEQLKAAGIST